MKFSRSFFGYDPASVDTELEFLVLSQKRFEDEKRLAAVRAQKEHELLLAKMSSLKGQLEADHGVVLLTDKYQSYVRTNLFQKANAIAEEKIAKLLKDAEEFEADAAVKSNEIDAQINGLTREIKSVIKVIEDILEFNDFGKSMMDTQLKEIEDMLTDFQCWSEAVPDLSDIGQIETPVSVQEVDQKEQEGSLQAAAAAQTQASLPIAANSAAPAIILVEHDEDSAILIRYFLEREGFQVIHANDGPQAARLINESAAPALVVLNVMVSNIDGLELIKQIRDQDLWQSVPIIGLTEMNSELDVVQILESGATDCLKKPFNPRELVARVKRFYNSEKKDFVGL